jgi:hypothetical protein
MYITTTQNTVSGAGVVQSRRLACTRLYFDRNTETLTFLIVRETVQLTPKADVNEKSLAISRGPKDSCKTPKVTKDKNMVMSPAEPGTEIDCAGERQQQFTRPDPRGSVQCSADSDEKLVISV